MFLIKRALCVVNNFNQNYKSVIQGADTKNKAVSYELKTARSVVATYVNKCLLKLDWCTGRHHTYTWKYIIQTVKM